ncbi:unnamed protein product [Rotaria sp. Silwood1]|nr:unnamed protein product [Rotaria sp. Silwood1]
MAQNTVQYCVLSFTATGTCKSYDELKQWCLDDDCYEKLYPAIANNILLEGLTEFVQNENNHPEKSGIANSTIYRKPNGRKIDSSRNYKLVREADDLNIFHLYVEITKGQNRDHFKMLTNSMECEFLLKVALEKMRDSGINSTAKDLKDAADKENLFVARERCEFINRCVLANIAITTATTPILYDVTKFGNDSKQKPKQQQTTKRTKKPVVSTSKCLTKSSDSEEDDYTESASKLMVKNNRLTPKLDRLRPRTVGVGAKQLAGNSHKPSNSSSSDGKKQQQDEKDDDNMKQILKKKQKTCRKKN